MEQYDALKRAVGRADACELLSRAFSYPDDVFATALVEGALADDARSCLLDMGMSASVADDLATGLRAWAESSVADVLSEMRKTYSRLYLAPGGHTPVFPYESAFLHVSMGAPGVPSLFRTPVTLDVERCMREVGVMAKNGRKEPCDSVQEELEFLSYLFAQQAEAVRTENKEALTSLNEQTQAFLRSHALAWLPRFMEQTCDLTDGPYAALALYASAVLTSLPDEE